MKINKKKPVHWFYLIKLVTYLGICIPLRFFLKKNNTNKTVILYGHKLHGNLLSIYHYSNNNILQPIKIKYFTLDPEYYQTIKQNKPNILGLNFKDILEITLSHCIISDHGLHALILLLYFTNIRFIDVWHGIPFKGFIPEDFKVQHQYHEIWVSSNYLKKTYIEKFSFSEKKVHVTGYGRCDILLEYFLNKTKIKLKYGININCKIILYAPTWKQDNKNRNEVPFDLDDKEFIDCLNQFAKQQNSTFILRYHLNTKIKNITEKSHIKFLPSDAYPNTEEILAISDILITDWSSIAFDMMTIKKPIIFIDVEAPFKNGFTLGEKYRAGAKVSTFNDLKIELKHAIIDETAYMNQYSDKYTSITQLVYDDTLDGHSTQRYMERLKNQLEINP